MPFEPASEALSRFTVLDLTRVRSGPTCVRQLADWGANVIKVEAPEAIEPDGSLGAARHTPDFQNLQRNKRSLTLNLKEDDAKAVLMKLVEKADVVVENFRPNVKRKLGIDYADLSAVNPKLVYASISGFGQDGPYENRPGFDQIAQGMGGLMSITGLPGQGPVRVGIPIADLTAGIFAAYGILVALLEREQSGKGQHVTSSLLEAQIFMLDFQAARWTIGKEVPPQAGNDHPTSIPTGVFETKDGHVNIASAGQVTYARLCDALDMASFKEHPDYATGPARSENRKALNAEINERTKKFGTNELVDLLAEKGVPCGPIYNIDQVFADAQVKHLGMAEKVTSPAMGDLDCVRQPIRLSRTPSKLLKASPEKGQETDEIMKDLGYSDADIAALRERNVI